MITITEHRHLTGNEEKELLPWLYYAAALNPHHELAYTVGGYWVGIRLKRPKEAIRFLREGLLNNPKSWEIYKTIGEVYYVTQKDYGKALNYLDRAKTLGNEQGIDALEKRLIYVPLAEAYAARGNPQESIKLYEELLKDFAGDEAIKNRIEYFKNLTQRTL